MPLPSGFDNRTLTQLVSDLAALTPSELDAFLLQFKKRFPDLALPQFIIGGMPPPSSQVVLARTEGAYWARQNETNTAGSTSAGGGGDLAATAAQYPVVQFDAASGGQQGAILSELTLEADASCTVLLFMGRFFAAAPGTGGRLIGPVGIANPGFAASVSGLTAASSAGTTPAVAGDTYPFYATRLQAGVVTRVITPDFPIAIPVGSSVSAWVGLVNTRITYGARWFEGGAYP